MVVVLRNVAGRILSLAQLAGHAAISGKPTKAASDLFKYIHLTFSLRRPSDFRPAKLVSHFRCLRVSISPLL